MKSLFPAALIAALTLTASPPAAAERWPVPSTVAEAKAQMASGVRGTANWPSYRPATPPGNVRAEDMAELFGNRVMIAGVPDTRDPAYDEIKLIFISRDGRYIWCNDQEDIGRGWVEDPWAAEIRRIRGKVLPIFNTNTLNPSKPAFSPLYDGATGEIIWYTPYNGRWYDWNRGHLQTRLPAGTWDLCPGFPSAKELGVGINPHQTASSYRELIAQHPGTRVLRPDLVTPDVRNHYTESLDYYRQQFGK